LSIIQNDLPEGSQVMVELAFLSANIAWSFSAKLAALRLLLGNPEQARGRLPLLTGDCATPRAAAPIVGETSAAPTPYLLDATAARCPADGNIAIGAS
jgi:hypothetical protein